MFLSYHFNRMFGILKTLYTTSMSARIVEGALTFPGAELADGIGANIYDSPGNADACIDQLDRLLSLYCTDTGLDTRHLAVRHLVNRTRHKAIGASLFHLAELSASARFLRAWNSEAEDLDMAAYTQDLPDTEPPAFPFEAPYRQYRTIESGVDRLAAQQVLDAVQTPAHPYHPVWQAYTRIQPEFAQTDYATRGFKRPDDPGTDFTNTLTDLPTDTLLPFLMPAALRYHRKYGITGMVLARKLMARSEEISWASTLSRNARKRSFPGAGQGASATLSCPYAIAEDDLYVPETTLDYFWDRPDIQMGPRESSSFCPTSNNILLVSKNPEDNAIADDLYAVQASFSGPRIFSRPPGAGCAAEMHIIRTIPLLGRTVLAAL
jgi:hypothetical protein